MTPINAEIQVKNLDHLGLVAGIIDELGIVEIINELLGIQPGEIVSAGVVVTTRAFPCACRRRGVARQSNYLEWIRFCLSTFIFISELLSR